MKTIKITTQELLELLAELQGIHTEERTILKGLIEYKLPIVVKYKLSKLIKTLNTEKDLFEEMRKDLVKTHSKEKDENGNDIIKPTVVVKGKEVINPDFVEYQKQFKLLLVKETELSFEDISIEEFKDIEIEGSFDKFFAFVV